MESTQFKMAATAHWAEQTQKQLEHSQIYVNWAEIWCGSN